MTSKSDKDFGKRKPVSVPVAPRPGPPAKRSGHVALLLMGTFAVGTAAYTLMPRNNCERSPDVPSPSLLQSNAECPPARLLIRRQPWRLGRRIVLAHQLLQQRFLLEPFINGHIRFRFARAQRGGFGSFAHAFGFSGG
jgi:hypothetical protein